MTTGRQSRARARACVSRSRGPLGVWGSTRAQPDRVERNAAHIPRTRAQRRSGFRNPPALGLRRWALDEATCNWALGRVAGHAFFLIYLSERWGSSRLRKKHSSRLFRDIASICSINQQSVAKGAESEGREAVGIVIDTYIFDWPRAGTVKPSPQGLRS